MPEPLTFFFTFMVREAFNAAMTLLLNGDCAVSMQDSPIDDSVRLSGTGTGTSERWEHEILMPETPSFSAFMVSCG